MKLLQLFLNSYHLDKPFVLRNKGSDISAIVTISIGFK